MAIPKIVQHLAADTYVGRGSVISDLQYSDFIRPHNETDCNGRTNPRGQLRDFDLKPFRVRFPGAVMLANQDAASQGGMDRTTVLYAWRHNRGAMQRNGERRTVFYGATLADEFGMILRRHVNNTPHAYDVVRYLENAAGLWDVSERARYLDAQGRRTLEGFRYIGGPESGPNRRAWMYYSTDSDSAPLGFCVNWRASESQPVQRVGNFGDDIETARGVMLAADDSAEFFRIERIPAGEDGAGMYRRPRSYGWLVHPDPVALAQSRV